MQFRDIFLHRNGDSRGIWLVLVLLAGLLPITGGCFRSASQELGRNSAPSALVMGTAEVCLERAVVLLADTDKAVSYCLAMRDREVARDTTTASAAARAAIAEGRVYILGDGWQGDGMYSGRYIATQQQYQTVVAGMGPSGFGHGTATGRNVVCRSDGRCY